MKPVRMTNAAFAAATKQERRIQIFRDVIALIDGENAPTCRSVYFDVGVDAGSIMQTAQQSLKSLLVKPLREDFSVEQLDLIESAFEGVDYHYTYYHRMYASAGNMLSLSEKRAFVLKQICLNGIAHRGRFVISDLRVRGKLPTAKVA